AIQVWADLAASVEPVLWRRVADGLARNRADAKIFRWVFDLYFDLKLGRLTEPRIDEALDACRDLRGSIEPDPMTEHPVAVWPNPPAWFRPDADQLRRERREPWLEAHWRANPAGFAIGPLPNPGAGPNQPTQ